MVCSLVFDCAKLQQVAVIIESKDRTLSDSAFCPIVQGYPDLIDNKRLLLLTGVGFLYSTSVDGKRRIERQNIRSLFCAIVEGFIRNEQTSFTHAWNCTPGRWYSKRD